MNGSQPQVVVLHEVGRGQNVSRSGIPLELLMFFWMGLISGFGLAFALVGLAALMVH